MEIFKLLDDELWIESYEVIEFREMTSAFYWKINVIFKDNSLLFAKEYVSNSTRKYAFHWQKGDGTLINRWDNAPHHPNIATSPHHQHIGNENNVKESYDISFEDILIYIFSVLQSNIKQ